MSRSSAWVAVIACVAVAGCVNDTPPSQQNNMQRQPPQCFQASSARHFRAVNSRTVNLRIGRDVYRIDTVGMCRDLNWTSHMRLATTGSSTVCTGLGLGVSIVTRGPSGQQRCTVQSITGLTPEQVAALPLSQRP
ncbi:hypothetical protein EDF56_105521 [Novosphingobium sp. PhB165]|uniref:DUF6491 family protein n=1 Tax=Novosphingobium sp. PhB165 TaxID=2485105 RepID=UPI00104EFE68|nr:DUF6491 family protein [Novosphingobium sp. PhB165]TCM18170.1 hypothetical protein EDF56_105521 [Novosphingobium sp. PhB165]